MLSSTISHLDDDAIVLREGQSRSPVTDKAIPALAGVPRHTQAGESRSVGCSALGVSLRQAYFDPRMR